MFKKLEESCDLQAFFAFLLSVILPMVVLFVLMMLFSCSPAYACPRLVEVFADPVDVSDQEGEFVEIRLWEGSDDLADGAAQGDAFDSLMVQFEEKPALRFSYPGALSGSPSGVLGTSSGVSRLVLVHDSVYCPQKESVACGLLGNITLPNSRETYWRTWAVKKGEAACLDSVGLPSPKAGSSFQRVKDSDRWVVAEPSLGEANPLYESGIKDCGLEPLNAVELSRGTDLGWSLRFSMAGCDSSWLYYSVEDLFGGKVLADTSMIQGRLEIPEAKGRTLWVRAALPSDEASGNDLLDTMLVSAGNSPVVVSEVHHCPQEPEPEWVEVYNRTGRSLPFNKFQFCGRGGLWSKNLDDSLGPFQSVIFTKDSSGLRDFLGYKDARLVQLSIGYLNNTSGNISICYGDQVLDSVAWDKSTATCPQGFNPLTGVAEYTPGFQRNAGAKNESPFTYKLSSRVVRRDGTPLRVLVESVLPVDLKLLDSTGHVLWKNKIPAQSNMWWNVPLEGLPRTGIAYVSLSSGVYENKVGIVLRP